MSLSRWWRYLAKLPHDQSSHNGRSMEGEKERERERLDSSIHSSDVSHSNLLSNME